jgi:hypothetical protein
MGEIGLLAAAEEHAEGAPPRLVIAKDDAWILEIFASLRAAGFTSALGFSARDLAIFEESVSALFARETRTLAARLGRLPPDDVARIIERAMPLIHTFLVRYHEALVRNFLAAL